MACVQEIVIKRLFVLPHAVKDAFEQAGISPDEWKELLDYFNAGKTAIFSISQGGIDLAYFNLERADQTLWGGWAGGGGHALGLWGKIEAWLVTEARLRECSEIGLISKRRGVYRMLTKKGYSAKAVDDAFQFKKEI